MKLEFPKEGSRRRRTVGDEEQWRPVLSDRVAIFGSMKKNPLGPNRTIHWQCVFSFEFGSVCLKLVWYIFVNVDSDFSGVFALVSIESTRSCHVTLYPVYNVPDRIIPSQTSKHTGGHVREEEGKVWSSLSQPCPACPAFRFEQLKPGLVQWGRKQGGRLVM